MEGIQFQRENLLFLANSVKLLLENYVFTEFGDNSRYDFSFLKKTLLDVQDVLLCHDLEKLIPIPAVNLSLDSLRYAVFHLATFFDKFDFSLRYDTPHNINLLKNLVRLNHEIDVINYKTKRLIEISLGLSSGEQLAELSLSNSNLDADSSIYGRDADIQKLKDMLLSSDSKIRVISIVGMGGIGKTALAKHLYNHPQVNDKFELRVWADFSEHVDEFSNYGQIFKTIRESITSQTTRNDTTDVTAINPKKLIVLDGVWIARLVNLTTFLMDNFNAWETGSRIIVTTRDERIAISMQPFLFVHYLRPLEVEDCWSLFSKYAFGPCHNRQQSHLEEIGREIAKKCYGLPLAAVAHGPLLRILLFQEDWNYVQESNVRDVDYEVHASLELSYNFLSYPLKQCFQYCSIFPKKSILEKKMVVQLWIAAGLLQPSSTDQEKVGEEYFDELVSKSLIHQRSIGDDEERNFEMHNLIHDMATEVSSPYYIHMDKHNLHDRVHTLSYNREAYDSYDKFFKLYELKGLSTFVALPLQEQFPLCLLSNKVVHDLLPTMKQLRMLSLSSYRSITKVPNSIGNLLHMRYLNLSHTNIESLPSEICKLYNLQFLLLAGCKRFTELPEDMGKLVNLRYLDVSNTALREMPVQIAQLKNLHTLSDFVVSKHNGGLNIAQLGKFLYLHGKLSISQLQNVNDPFEVDRANIKMKEQIDELALEWDCDGTTLDSQIQSDVLEKLRPSTNLKSLTIKGYGGINFPNWLGDSLFSNMVHLRISNCNDCLWLPSLGKLGNLKELVIEGMQSVETIGIEFYGSGDSSFKPFPSLESLHFENIQEWKEWDLIGDTAATMFPNLKTLSLRKCPKLIAGNITEKFPFLTELELRECPLLVQSMPLSDHVFRKLMFPLNLLQQLTIDGIPSSMSFPTNGLPKTLKLLIINNCENLEFLPLEYLCNYTSLEELKISYSCNSMTSFTLGALPVLKSLFIEGCNNLKSISIAEDVSLKSLSFLRSIKIWDCNELESFTLGGLATPNLRYIALWKCEKLHSLPEAMNSLAGLREMEIDNLPNLQSLVIDELPSSLQKLSVGSVGGIMWNTEPSWEHLTCLSVLRINGDDTVNMLMGPLLPTSLVKLCICGLDDTSIDEKWLQHLTSLQNLEIINAPKLKSLPKKGFPSSLSVLSVTRCPLLEASLLKKRGKEWRKIAHIPSIVINDELIT
ncbi:putative disease resistance protein At3g14460 isoform X1 [Vicia villosa]|uniref:putative disease resistance protein At3g14460 isoform X1 n=1 Tax=Vicia villosa TaxID=3911 RepID=UPI00273C4091|nr:putative disease resistance protein At3g14460 isoform X1 [Vicia villosa]